MSEVAPRGEEEFCIIRVRASRMEFGEAMSSVQPTAHEGAKGDRFRGDTGKDITGVSRDDVREVRDHGNAVLGIRSLVCRSVNRQGGMRKSRGRVRT